MKKITCEWCGKKVEQEGDEIPPGWKHLDYDVNKYTPEVDQALVCSEECEMRLAEKFAAGGFR